MRRYNSADGMRSPRGSTESLKSPRHSGSYDEDFLLFHSELAKEIKRFQVAISATHDFEIASLKGRIQELQGELSSHRDRSNSIVSLGQLEAPTEDVGIRIPKARHVTPGGEKNMGPTPCMPRQDPTSLPVSPVSSRGRQLEDEDEETQEVPEGDFSPRRRYSAALSQGSLPTISEVQIEGKHASADAEEGDHKEVAIRLLNKTKSLHSNASQVSLAASPSTLSLKPLSRNATGKSIEAKHSSSQASGEDLRPTGSHRSLRSAELEKIPRDPPRRSATTRTLVSENSETNEPKEDRRNDPPFALREEWAISDRASLHMTISRIKKRTLQKQRSLLTVIARQAYLLQGGGSSYHDGESDAGGGREHHRSVLHPQSTLRFIWDGLGFVLVFYDLIMLPLLLFELPDSGITIGFDWFAAIFWTFDMVLSFMTGVYVGGELVMHPQDIIWRYVKSWFIFDLCCIIPLWVGLLFKLSILNNFSVVRSIRMLRLCRLVRLAKLELYFDQLTARLNSNYVVLCVGIGRSISYLLLVNHAVACAWCRLGNQERGWLSDEPLEVQGDFLWTYLTAFHWSLAQFHSSMEISPHTMQERAFAVCVLLLALIMFSSFLSSVTNLMIQLQRLRHDRTWNNRTLRSYLKDHDISSQLTVRVKMCLARKEKQAEGQQRYDNQAKLLQVLPAHILCDLHEEARMPIITMHDQMQELYIDYPRTLRMVCHEATHEIWAQHGDTIFSQGDACSRMLFPEKGQFIYKTASAGARGPGISGLDLGHLNSNIGKTTKLSRGSWLSEAALWVIWENVGQMKAGTDGFMLSLEVESFVRVVKLYERAFGDVTSYADRFVKHINKAGCTDLGPVEPNMEPPAPVTHSEATKRKRFFWGRATAARDLSI